MQELELDDQLIPKRIRYTSTGDFEKMDNKGVWKYEEAIDSLCKKRIFKYYLEGIDALITTPDDTKQNLNPEKKNNPQELQNNSGNSSNENNISNNKPDPQKRQFLLF